ncbi:MAG: hypothetical protein KJ063_24015 [Anaerolineae bacterium]|nr:hypothetical protein [Anaerolineae bacterium]
MSTGFGWFSLPAGGLFSWLFSLGCRLGRAAAVGVGLVRPPSVPDYPHNLRCRTE